MITHSAHIFLGKALTPLAPKLAAYVAAAAPDEVAPRYHSADVSGCADTASLRQYLVRLYTSSVTINDPGTGFMGLTIYCAAYDTDAVRRAAEVAEAAVATGKKYRVEVIAVADDLAHLFDPDLKAADIERLHDSVAANMALLAHLREQGTAETVRLIQNVNTEGLALNLDIASLIRLTGEYAMLRMEHHDHVVSPLSRMNKERPIDSMGLSVMNFDRDYFVDYLHSRAFIEMLTQEHVDTDKVSINVATKVSQDILVDLRQRIADFYRDNVAVRLTKNFDRNKVIAEITPMLDSLFTDIVERLTGCIDNREYSLPEKVAIVAMLLGDDNELFSDAAVSDTQLSIDDLWAPSLDTLVKEHNRSVNDEDPLSNPLAQIKELKTRMRNSSVYLRQCITARESKRELIGQQEQVAKRLTEKGFTFEGTVYRIDSVTPDDRPLEKDYEAHAVNSPSIDLRSGFANIKNQGSQGACGAFSVVSMIEYLIHRSLPASPHPDLSEAFLYYYSRACDGKTGEDCGTSFYSSVKALMEHGICAESLHPYREEEYSRQPSQEAIDDALKRMVTEAKNVECSIGAIKSAISDGYPVAISTRLFDSFAGNGSGFVPFPDESELSAPESYHAMVVAGYSDADRVLVVRNSWGSNFGDGGYCYLPYAYAEKYIRQAIIITGLKVDGAAISTMGPAPTEVVQFNTTDNRIQEALLGIAIEEETEKLRKMHELYTRLRAQYDSLILTFTNANTRKSLSDCARRRLDMEIAELQKREEETYTKGTEEYHRFKRDSLRFALIMTGLALASAGVWTGLDDHPTWAMILIFLFGIPATLVWLGRVAWAKRIKRLRNEAVEALAEQRGRKETEKRDIDMRIFVHGMMLDRLNTATDKVKRTYDRLKSFLGNLRAWRREETDHIGTLEPVNRDPFIPIIANEALDGFFDNRCRKLVGAHSVCEQFGHYRLSDDGLVEVKDRIKQQVDEILDSVTIDFSMYDYLSRSKVYDYLPEPMNACDLLPMLMRKSASFLLPFHPDNVNNRSGEVRLYMHFPSADILNGWLTSNSSYFYQAPAVADIISPGKIVMLTTHRHSIDEIYRQDTKA